MPSSPRHRVVIGLGVVLVAGTSLWAVAAEDLLARIENLRQEGRYDLALQILEDREMRGEKLGPDLHWARARLQTDPDAFDQIAHDVARSISADDPRVVEWTVARAKEHFAQGRYQTAADLLAAVGVESRLGDPEASFFLAMAWQALGEVDLGEEVFDEIPDDHPAHLPATAVQAELILRSGRLDEAQRRAELLLAEDPQRYGPQARLVLARVAEREGDVESARRWREELRRLHPRAVEAGWRPGVRRGEVEVTDARRFAEIEAPDPRRSYALQLGAFRDRSLALRFAGGLAGKVDGLRVEVDRTETPPWYRVVGGEYMTRSQAQEERQRLMARDIQAIILGPERGRR